MDFNQILDYVTIVTSIFSLVWIFENMLIYFAAWDVFILWCKFFIWRQPGFIRWCADGTWKFHLAFIDPANPKKWILKLGGKEIQYEIKKGSVGIGPLKVPLMLIADEYSGGAGIPLNDLLEGRAIGATPAHISAIEKSAYAEGYTEGFNKSTPGGTLEWLKENWWIAGFMVILLIIGSVTMYDKIISSPAAWQTANACEQQKAILLGKLGQAGVNINDIYGVTTTTITKPPAGNMADVGQSLSNAVIGGK